ncbi:MAG: GPW/gp25 family protein [Parvibaculum sp.]|uniref:GPW/gp25 family protein n=1 Tax=Chelatococcus sp. TaxID=1953771 RepID=UPI001EB51041|nr:GPW/gp25 family protein [Chelatococcus sp.]MBX3506844.1 GPW/gp25 family protein [Parvibaculum sp.]MBX3545591.1 GPW/gp25 family protein [Chelatococcus sp.]
MIRYRTGIDRRTGEILVGWPHVQQSIEVLMTTRPTEMVMLLDYGLDLIKHIGRGMHRGRVITLYRELVTAVHRWEPEYRIHRLYLVEMDRTGVLGLGTKGRYYPEGRFGNYDIFEPADGAFPLATSEGAA